MESLFITVNQLKHKPWPHKQTHSKTPNLCKDSSTEDWHYSTNIFTWNHWRWGCTSSGRDQSLFLFRLCCVHRKASPKMKRMEIQGGGLQFFKEPSAVSPEYNVNSGSLLRVAFMWWKTKYLKDDKPWTVNDNSDSEEEKAVYVWLWGKCNPVSLTH